MVVVYGVFCYCSSIFYYSYFLLHIFSQFYVFYIILDFFVHFLMFTYFFGLFTHFLVFTIFYCARFFHFFFNVLFWTYFLIHVLMFTKCSNVLVLFNVHVFTKVFCADLHCAMTSVSSPENLPQPSLCQEAQWPQHLT